MEKKRSHESLFQEFMDFVKKRKRENSPQSSASNASNEWPVEYLNDSFEEYSDQETEGKQKGGGQYEDEDVQMGEEADQTEVKEEKIVLEEDELDEELLNLLGKEKECNNEKSPKIHDELAKRWNNVLEKGLDKDEKHSITNKYPPIENILRLVTPKINPEAEAAMSDQAKKRDRSISTKQKQVAVAISALGGLLSKTISNKENIDKKEMIMRISDAGRILCDLFYEDNKMRRFYALENLNKEMRQSLQQRQPEEFLFGNNLSEGIRTAKAVAKAAQDLKIKTVKNRNLNSQGPHRNNNNLQYQGKNNAARGRGPVQQKPNTTHTQRKKETQQKRASQGHSQRSRPHH